VKTAVVLSAFVWVALCAAAEQQHFDGKSWWHHVEILAADDMEGRGTGTPGLERAEAYVVGQLKKSGLVPSGPKGYYQPVQLESREVVQADSSAALVGHSKTESLVLGEDAVFVSIPKLAPRFEAPLVFLGYGLRVPEKNHDDLAGRELKGKVAVTMAGEPEGMTGQLSAHYQDTGRRWEAFRSAGMVGWIVIPPPYVPGVSGTAWSYTVDFNRRPQTDLAGDQFDDARGGQLSMVFNPAHADMLFQGTGHTTAELFALGRDHKPLPHFDLPVRIRTITRLLKKPFSSANVVAKLEGSDPRLRNEYVVLSAHIDHVGIDRADVAASEQKPVNGDRIYNGALDNASGCAALLDIAADLKKERVRPKRSILFVFFTGEELEMLGSKYFTAQPPVARASIVADLTIDTIHALVPLKKVAVFGLEDSDLGDAARRAAASQNIAADSARPPVWSPAGILGNDSAGFVLHGIPALRIMVGFSGEQAALLENWRRNFYHTPVDDVHQPVNLDTAAKYEELMMQLLLDVANSPRRPEWKSSSFYKRYAR
jgi:hypothetical protein